MVPRMTRWVRMFLAVVTMAGAPAVALAQVPSEFADLYDELFNDVTEMRRTISQSWDRSRSPVAFSANLMSANSQIGPALLKPDYIDLVRHELEGLKALGVSAILLDIDFPVLYRPFHATAQEHAAYLSFYMAVAAEIRANDMKLVIETQSLFDDPSFSNWNIGSYYAGLTVDQYQRGRMEVASILVAALRPDYISVIQEPDTEAAQTGKPDLGTVAGSTALLRRILAGLAALGPHGAKIGAGVGTWQKDYALYVNNFAAEAIDFIDMHVYPPNRDFLVRAIEIADIAHASGKEVAMTETWLYKTRESELGSLSYGDIFRRDPFAFWAPLDALHLRAMVELSHYKKLLFMSPFWSGFFRAYVDYDGTTRLLPYALLKPLLDAAQFDNMLNGVYTKTGHAYKNAIATEPDAVPPAAPGGLAAHLTSPTGAVLDWSGSSDNIGTATYVVFRGFTRIAQTALTHYSEEGLAEAQDYVYTVFAVDASGNRSAASRVMLRTPDMTPPSMPIDLSVVPSISGTQLNITLRWTPSTDNVGVQQYRVYYGSSPDAMSVIALAPSPTYTVSKVPPNTRFYFAVSALDAAFNASPIGPTVSLTTPIIPDTTKPTVSDHVSQAGSDNYAHDVCACRGV